MPTTPLQYGDLANQINEFMAGQANNQYVSNLPNYANMVGKRTENIGQQLRGQLPQDVINQIGQQAAERGIAGGSPGSPNSNAAYLRALGLNSLQMQQQGNQNLSTAIGDTPVSPLFNPASMIVPNYFGQQELNNAQAGQRQNQNRGGGGVTSTSFPALNLGRSINRDAGYGSPIVGSNPMGTLPDRALSPDQWWNQYGGRNLSSNANFGQSTYNPFAEEDAYFAGGQTGYGAQQPDTGGGYDYSGNSGFGWNGGGGGDYMTDYSGGQESGFWEDYE